MVTKAEASKILDAYQSKNNRANATRNRDVLATVEGGQVFERSTADYEQFSTFSAEKRKDYGTPFFYTHREYFIPSGTTWFAVTAQTNESKKKHVLVFDKAGGSWKMTAAVTADDPLPAIDTTRSGVATAVPADQASGTLTPEQVGPAFEDFYATGGKRNGKQLDRTTAAAKTAVKIHDTRNDKLGPQGGKVTYFATTPEHTKIYTLKTDRGSLALVPLSHKAEILVTRPGLQVNPAKDEAVYNPRPRPLIVSDYHGQALADLPTAGKPSILGFEYALVDSH
ncbi:hypothetical protein [Streptomyces sp. 7N604]|uniref:hypothetical protein n=1 Tax=Streptomyces sp. 7N604 TaxID=3457415 RepID=UPI003FD68B32